MKRSLFFTVALLAVAAGACSSSSSDADPNAPANEDDITKAGWMNCGNMGWAGDVYTRLQGNKITVTIQGVGTSTGTQIADPAPGFSAFASWTPDDAGMKDFTLWVSKDGKAVQAHQENVGPYYDGTCRAATSKELTADTCIAQVRNVGDIDTRKNPVVAKVSDTLYTATYASSQAGDFVWQAAVKREGFLCRLGKITAVSCSAIVADAIRKKALDDGSSAGEPYVNKLGDGFTWNGGIHDPESGDFAYDLQTDSFKDGCKVTSIKEHK